MRRLSTLLVLLCGLLHWSHADGKCDKLQERIQKDATRFSKHQCKSWECGEIEGQECADAGTTCLSAMGYCGAGQECCLKTDTGTTGTTGTTGPTEPTGRCPVTTSISFVLAPSLSCFVVHQGTVTWTEARDACDSVGGHLAILDTEDRLDVVIIGMSRNMTAHPSRNVYHLGGLRPLPMWNSAWPASGQDFVWLDGQPVNVTVGQKYWTGDGPNNLGHKDNTLSLISVSGAIRLVDTYPARPGGYVCEHSLVF